MNTVNRDAILNYPEGLPASLPESTYVSPDPVGNSVSKINVVRRFNNMIPSSLISDNRLSTTSNPKDCFVYRRNSKRMQELLIDFSYNFKMAYNLTQEV